MGVAGVFWQNMVCVGVVRPQSEITAKICVFFDYQSKSSGITITRCKISARFFNSPCVPVNLGLRISMVEIWRATRSGIGGTRSWLNNSVRELRHPVVNFWSILRGVYCEPFELALRQSPAKPTVGRKPLSPIAPPASLMPSLVV